MPIFLPFSQRTVQVEGAEASSSADPASLKIDGMYDGLFLILDFFPPTK